MAAPCDEARWIERARALTASALEREVRRVDVGSLEAGAAEVDRDEPDTELAREGVRIRCTPRVLGQFHRARRVANRVAGETLPVWAAMEAVAAEVASALPVEDEAEDAEGMFEATRVVARRRRRTRRWEPERRGRDEADLLRQLPGFLEALVRDLHSVDTHELDARLRRALLLEQRLEAELGPRLLAVFEGRHHRSVGRSFDRYARERLGVSPRRARALMRVERAGRRCPSLRQAYRSGSLSWVQAQEIVPLVWIDRVPTGDWVRFAQTVSVRRLRDEVARALVRAEQRGGPAATPPDRVGVDTDDEESEDRQTRARATDAEETACPFFSAPRSVARLFRAVMCTVRRRLQRQLGRPVTEGEAFGAMLAHALEAWGADAPTSRAHRVFERDGWRCTAPGCTSYRNLHDHHIRFRSAGGSDALSNRTTLCAWHHLRGVHAGIVHCTGEAPGRLRFELGVRADGPPAAVYRSGDVLA